MTLTKFLMSKFFMWCTLNDYVRLTRSEMQGGGIFIASDLNWSKSL